MKTWTRQELTNLTTEQFNKLSEEEKKEVLTQGKQYLIQQL